LTNLEWLDLHDIAVLDISALSGLTNMRYLSLDFNGVSDLNALAGMTDLRVLTVTRNRIADISGLAEMTNLEYLNFGSIAIFGENPVEDWSPLARLTNLRVLESPMIVHERQYGGRVDLTPLSGLMNLDVLVLTSSISASVDLEPLRGLNLRGLRVHTMNGGDISPLADIRSLEELDLGHHSRASYLEDLTPLAGLTNLIDLRIRVSDDVIDLSPLAELTELVHLTVNGRFQFEDLTPFMGLVNLRELDFRQSSVRDAGLFYEWVESIPNLQNVFLPRTAIPDDFNIEDYPDWILSTTGELSHLRHRYRINSVDMSQFLPNHIDNGRQHMAHMNRGSGTFSTLEMIDLSEYWYGYAYYYNWDGSMGSIDGIGEHLRRGQ
jgi:internalin A